MKIEIKERVFHFRQPAGTSRGVYTERRSWMVEMSDGTRRGVGECAPLPDLSCDAMEPHIYKKVLRGFCDEVEHSGMIPYEALRDYPSMLFGIETAMQDLEQPASAGRPQANIPINGLVWMGTYDEMLRRMEEKLRAGFHCVKLKVGAIDFDRELDLVRRIRSRFSRCDVELRLDANGGFRPAEALERLRQLARYDIHSIEQPVRQGQWDEMATLCRVSPLPIALDEELIGVNTTDAKVRLLDTIRPQYIVLKPSLHGGVSGTLEWVALARERGIGSWITSALESNVGLYAVACLAIRAYGEHITFPQGLGTGQLFTDNIAMPLEVRGEKLLLL